MSSEHSAASLPDAPGAGWVTSLMDLYREERRALVRLVVILGHDTATAEDVVQTSFLKLMSARPALHTPGAELWYVRRAVVNTARSEARERDPVLYLAALEPRVNADVPSAESRVVEDSERDALMDAVRQLPRRQRDTLALSLEGYQPAEIASALGIEPNTARVNLHHARVKLAAILRTRAPAA